MLSYKGLKTIMHHTISAEKTAHIYTHNSITKNTKYIWIVLHGYGQLAKYFIRKFYSLGDEHFIIAPEALSRFYISGYSGRVGANWMTKEDRLTDINDYINYLDKVYETFVLPYLSDNIKINVVGFSQGGATASRWAAATKHKLNNLILWSCIFPEDLHFPAIYNKDLNLFLLYGDKDEFNVNKQVDSILPVLKKQKLNCTVIPFNGKHDIPANVLQEFTNKFL
jgi:predicted esterase